MYVYKTTCDTTYDETDVDNTNCDSTVSLTTFLMEPMKIFSNLPIPMIIPMYITQTVILHLPIPMMKQM